jgi:hypothetical protein
MPTHYVRNKLTICKSTITNVATVRIFEVLSDKVNVERICTYVRIKQNNNRPNNSNRSV